MVVYPYIAWIKPNRGGGQNCTRLAMAANGDFYLG